jgi:hypothetical protein
MEDDPMMRELTAHPKHRRVLITDARSPVTEPLIAALQRPAPRMSGSARRRAGGAGPAATGWRRWTNVTLVPLDVTDTDSLRCELAAEIGGKTDILINTARFVRPGGVMGATRSFARDEMEVNALGLMRLAQAFGPAMASRTADGQFRRGLRHCASVHALAPDPDYGAFAASQAAARIDQPDACGPSSCQRSAGDERLCRPDRGRMAPAAAAAKRCAEGAGQAPSWSTGSRRAGRCLRAAMWPRIWPSAGGATQGAGARNDGEAAHEQSLDTLAAALAGDRSRWST